MITAQDIREMTEPEIAKKLRETRDEYMNLRLRKQVGQVEHPHKFKELRKEIARLETIIREKELSVSSI